MIVCLFERADGVTRPREVCVCACAAAALAQGHAPRHYISSLFAGLLSQKSSYLDTRVCEAGCRNSKGVVACPAEAGRAYCKHVGVEISVAFCG